MNKYAAYIIDKMIFLINSKKKDSFIAEIDSLKCYEGTSSIVNNVIKVDASSNTCSKKYCMVNFDFKFIQVEIFIIR